MMIRVFILMLGLCSPLFAQDAPEVIAGVDTQNGDSEPLTPPPFPASGARGTEVVPWLHVEVETKYTWISQTSIARCWTTKSRDDTTRVNVGQLCLMLDAHWTHKTCETDTCYLEIKEVRRRVAVPKATATVTAWSENPHIEQTSVKMAP